MKAKRTTTEFLTFRDCDHFAVIPTRSGCKLHGNFGINDEEVYRENENLSFVSLFRSSVLLQIWSFNLVERKRTAKKFTQIMLNARAWRAEPIEIVLVLYTRIPYRANFNRVS